MLLSQNKENYKMTKCRINFNPEPVIKYEIICLGLLIGHRMRHRLVLRLGLEASGLDLVVQVHNPKSQHPAYNKIWNYLPGSVSST